MDYELKFSGARLRQALADADIKQEQLARDLGVTLGAVSKWCRDLSQPMGIQLVRMAACLDKPEAWFFEEREKEAA